MTKVILLDITQTADQQQAAQNYEKEKERLMDFKEAEIILKRTINDWRSYIAKAVTNRKKRDVEVNVEQLRQSGSLDEDETLIPVRVIDTNIQREQPAYINYLKNSRRLCTFRSLDNPDTDSQNLELAFTQGMTYLSWEIPHYKCIDGSSTHGWDTIEVVYDENYPLNVGSGAYRL
jgi:translation initiation factor 2 beta subunit (eIF-2beta)/eIF-5